MHGFYKPSIPVSTKKEVVPHFLPLHDLRQWVIFVRLHHKMDMIAHQDPMVEFEPIALLIPLADLV